jgi:hypothetical protein
MNADFADSTQIFSINDKKGNQRSSAAKKKSDTKTL